jgi:hypothetical protein
MMKLLYASRHVKVTSNTMAIITNATTAMIPTYSSSSRCMIVHGYATTTCSYMSSTASTEKPIFSSNHKHYPIPNAMGSVIYTETDEAPALATYSLYPVVSKVNSFWLFHTRIKVSKLTKILFLFISHENS